MLATPEQETYIREELARRAAVDLSFYAADGQEFCDPCSIGFILRNHGTVMVKVNPRHERVCDVCGAHRDGTGAGRRDFS